MQRSNTTDFTQIDTSKHLLYNKIITPLAHRITALQGIGSKLVGAKKPKEQGKVRGGSHPHSKPSLGYSLSSTPGGSSIGSRSGDQVSNKDNRGRGQKSRE